MGSLMNSLGVVAESMRTLQEAINVTGNNVSNARAPGYARQRLGLVSRPMHLEGGLAGGLDSSGLISTRRQYLERGVQSQTHDLGRYSQLASTLEGTEAIFDVSSQSGLARGLDGLFGAFSQWSVNPNDTPARENVLRQASSLAQTFNNVSSAVSRSREGAASELGSSVAAINRAGEIIRNYNLELRQDIRRKDDPGLDAQIHAKLEELAAEVDFSVLRSEDGSVNLYLGGQTPLVIGENFYRIGTDNSSGRAVIHDHAGKDITGQLDSGRVRALLDAHNTLLPGYSAQLDRLAAAAADRVNSQLAAGIDRNGAPGAALFQYDPALGAASSIRVAGISPAQLAAAAPSAPGGNGNALLLGSLGTSKEIDGYSFSQFYGQTAALAGRDAANAKEDERTQGHLLSQAKSLREDLSGVSLDEEAANLVEFQRSYQASAELVRILNSLTETTLNLLR